MSCAHHTDDPSAALLAAAREVVPDWLRRLVVTTASRSNVDPATFGTDLEEMVERESGDLLDALDALLAADVDAQRTNPLSLFRAAVAGPTALLLGGGVPLPSPDRFMSEAFPDDPYRLGPATWSDIDERLHEPGITWGAWKAMTVLQRRRAEGLR